MDPKPKRPYKYT